MAPEKRDGGQAQAQGRRIPISPAVTPSEKAQLQIHAKSGIPSPRKRTASGGGSGIAREKEATLSAILSAPNAVKQRPLQATAVSKLGKPASRPASSQSGDDKDDIRQRDNRFRRDGLSRDKALRDLAPRRPAPTMESTNLTDAGKRLLLKSNVAASCVLSPNSKAAPAAASSKAPPRSVSMCGDRLGNELRTSIMRRSISVGKGRILANQTELGPQVAGAKGRPPPARSSSATTSGAPYRPLADRRDASVLRPRPLSATSGKSDVLLSSTSKSALAPITEAPSKPAAHSGSSTSGAVLKYVMYGRLYVGSSMFFYRAWWSTWHPFVGLGKNAATQCCCGRIFDSVPFFLQASCSPAASPLPQPHGSQVPSGRARVAGASHGAVPKPHPGRLGVRLGI